MKPRTHRRKTVKKSQRPKVRLTRMQKITLKDNREILRDMGLKMPAITPKYWSAIQKLSARSGTSIAFYHLAAARNGQQVFYNELKNLGYMWKNNKWIRIKKKAKIPR